MGLLKGRFQNSKDEIGAKWKDTVKNFNLILRGAVFVILTTFATAIGFAGAQSAVSLKLFLSIAIPLSTVVSIIILLMLRIKADTLKEVFIQSFLWTIMYFALLLALSKSSTSRKDYSDSYTVSSQDVDFTDPTLYAVLLIIPLGMFLGTLVVYCFRKLGKRR